MFFLIRSAFWGAIFYGLFVWGVGAVASWSGYIVTTCLVAVFLFAGMVSVTTLKWGTILAIVSNINWDENYRQ
jgi:hypothetical protein